jgi:class 3 adenylate cyclase
MVFSGHMIDMPGRAIPRFPAELEAAVAREIQERIAVVKPGFGFSSAACGSDILFLEAMLEAGAEIAIVLPYKEEAFVRDSVDFIPGGNWRARFSHVLEKSARVVTASSQRLEIGGISYDFCNQLLFGLAAIRARQLGAQLVPLTVWDGKAGDGPGGAASVVEIWRASGYEPEIVDLAKFTAGGATSRGDVKVLASTEPRLPELFGSRIVAILFADAIGFSKLGETEVPRFIEHFLGAVARWSEKFGETVLTQNTWGDAIYYVFSDVDSAGKFALAVADLAASTDWPAKGLPADLSLRIALHAGPAYEFMDPITNTRTYGGTHVSRTARMEPITPRGQVYASEAFAALAAAHAVRDFTCDYVGQIPLAKSYGTLPTYHVRAAVNGRSLSD